MNKEKNKQTTLLRREIYCDAGLRVREADPAGGSAGEPSRTVEGYAVLFGVRSVVLADWGVAFFEQMEAGSITREFLDTQDIVMNMYHNNQRILARSSKGKGSLRYEVDAKGVRFEFEAPATSAGDELLELVRRGDLQGCSFCYATHEDPEKGLVSYERAGEKDARGREILLRRVKQVTGVYDFAVVVHPAYPATEVQARDLEAIKALNIAPNTTEETAETEAQHQARESAAKAAAEQVRDMRARATRRVK